MIIPFNVSDTRETSFLYAIVGTGALQAVAEGCSQGHLLSCSCRDTYKRPAPPRQPPPGGSVNHNDASSKAAEDWTWGGCVDDVAFAYTKSKQFVDVERNTRTGSDFRAMLQSHNYEAGRLVRVVYFIHMANSG